MSKLHRFKTTLSEIERPTKFNFPFYYTPHTLCVLASQEVQVYLNNQTEILHNFGLDPKAEGSPIGKMFGVLVVQDQQKQLGYLAAFSGKLANSNEHDFFVPPVFDLLSSDGFFVKEEEELNQMNASLEKMLQQEEYLQLKKSFSALQQEANEDLLHQKEKIKLGKQKRTEVRLQLENLAPEEASEVQFHLNEESKKESILLKKMNAYWKYRLTEARSKLAPFEAEIENLKKRRSAQSAALQQKIFNHYTFLNAKGEEKSLGAIFGTNPPAGAGECAAPKLLQYAYANRLSPVALAEFWWGASPPSEVRKHRGFYPSCRSKCEPILGHMLQGLEVEANPLLENPAQHKDIEIVYEDEAMAVVLKPAEFLSVPGKQISDSVVSRVQQKFPTADGPLVVHRLDMSTSGLMLIAKNTEAYKILQAQFIQRKVYKRYEALLEREVQQERGIIDLPLRVDLDNRPHQLVCYEHGKNALTHWERVEVKDGKTRVYFYPITGRTHQLRVHAAHQLGLNAPIVGDDLYGNKANRLHLHAGLIRFLHPVSKKEMSFIYEADF